MNRRVLLTFCLLSLTNISFAQSRARFSGGRPSSSQKSFSSSRASYNRYTPTAQSPAPTRSQTSSSYSYGTGSTASANYQPARYVPSSFTSARGFRPMQRPVLAPRQTRLAEPTAAPIPQTTTTEEQPVPRSGALIRTEGLATHYGSATPSLLHQVESGGGFITMEAGRGQSISGIGVHMGQGGSSGSGQASGRNGITTIE